MKISGRGLGSHVVGGLAVAAEHSAEILNRGIKKNAIFTFYFIASSPKYLAVPVSARYMNYEE